MDKTEKERLREARSREREARRKEREIKRTEREERRAARDKRKRAIAECTDWEMLFRLICTEEEVDAAVYQAQMEAAGIDFETLREIAGHSRVRMKRVGDSIEISFRKHDHSVALMVPKEGRAYYVQKDFFDYEG